MTLDIAILAGGEARRTRVRARKAEQPLNWPTAPESQTPRIIGDELVLNHPSELARGVMMPVQIYPIFESAIRARSGATPAQHVQRISELWARFSEVAAGNPYAWSRQARTAEEIRTPSSENRMVGLPYTKYMNSNNDVDMAAAIIMCSAEKAESLGVPRDHWVFVHAGTDCHEHQFVSNRWSFTETPAIELGGRRVLELAGCTIDDVALVDLYSCFPSAVQLGAQSLGLSLDRQLTRTGGLSFAGGPWNNYVMHAIATMVGRASRPAGRTSAWCGPTVGTRPSTRSASTRPSRPSVGSERRSAGGDRRAAASRSGGARRCRRAGDDRGLHGDALARGRAGDLPSPPACWPTAGGRGERRPSQGWPRRCARASGSGDTRGRSTDGRAALVVEPDRVQRASPTPLDARSGQWATR